MAKPEVYTVKQALERISKYCAYQERCQMEVRNKLSEFDLNPDEIEEVISELIQQNFLNEERFSRAFARGKFRINGWGKKKIGLALAQKQVSSACIQLGFQEISPDEYREKLRNFARKEMNKHSKLPEFQKKAKVAQYLIGKGYESELVWDELNVLNHD
jgi:regulatory protein